MVPPENAVLPEPYFTLAEIMERGGYRTRFEKGAAVNWINARARSQSGCGPWRIVAVTKTGPSHAPAELRPFFDLRPTTFPATLLHATTIRRKRGPSLSRRKGQSGTAFKNG